MARGKHATALFEVIHASRMPNKPVLTTPKWWFKRADKRSADMTSIAAASNSLHDTSATPFYYTEPTVPSIAEPVDQPHPVTAHATCGVRAHEKAAATITTDVEPTEVYGSSISNRTTELKPPVASVIAIHQVDDSVDEAIDARLLNHSEPAVAANSSVHRQGLDVAVDSNRKLITLRLSFNNAIITAFSVLIVVTLAFFIGKKMSAGPSTAIAMETSEQLRGKPAHPDVLNLTPPSALASRTTKTSPTPKAETSASSQIRDPEEAISSATDNGNSDPAKLKAAQPLKSDKPDAPLIADRQIGLNYVVIASFPDAKAAGDARDLLVKGGVNCSVEKGLRGFPGLCLVATDGYTRIKNSPEFDDYCRTIDKTATQVLRGYRGKLIAYKWDKVK